VVIHRYAWETPKNRGKCLIHVLSSLVIDDDTRLFEQGVLVQTSEYIDKTTTKEFVFFILGDTIQDNKKKLIDKIIEYDHK